MFIQVFLYLGRFLMLMFIHVFLYLRRFLMLMFIQVFLHLGRFLILLFIQVFLHLGRFLMLMFIPYTMKYSAFEWLQSLALYKSQIIPVVLSLTRIKFKIQRRSLATVSACACEDKIFCSRLFYCKRNNII